MAQINTALGPIEPSALGQTLMHEHLFVMSPEIEKWPVGLGVDPSEEWDEEARATQAIDKLRDLKRHGIDTLVDLTVIGLGRQTALVQRVARAVPEINVVVATGLYTFNDVPHFFRNAKVASGKGGIDLMTEMWVRDIRVGIANLGVRAGMLKCATDLQGITDGVEQVLRSVARAHRQTGTPISTHTPVPPEPWGLEQQRIFREEGVDLTQVVIGHSGGTLDERYQKQLMDAGSYIGMDRFGYNPLGFDKCVQNVARLAKDGYAGRMVLSHDCVCYTDWFGPGMEQLYPDWHWKHISNDVLPGLRKAGVSDADLHQMMVINPATILTPCAPY